MRYNDVRHGRTDVDAVVKEYQNAWEKKGMVTDDGMYISWLFQRQDMLIPAHDIGLTAWYVPPSLLLAFLPMRV